MRVLRDLDAPREPQVGPVVTLAAPVLGAARPDVGVEVSQTGRARPLVTWSERTADSSYALMVAWVGDHQGPQPMLGAATALQRDTSAARSATIAATPSGARVAVRADGGRLRVFGHDETEPLTTWWSTGAGVVTPTGAYPSAVGLDSGEVLVAAARDLAQGIVTVQRFGGPGSAPSQELEMTGFAQPAITVDTTGPRVVAIRSSDGFVVSRSRSAEAGWDATDRVEIGSEGGGNHAWPSLLRSRRGPVRMVVRGPGDTTNRSSVLAYEQQPSS